VESEEPVQQHLAELFARVRPECVLDVGANAGQYGALLRRHGFEGWIISLEPVRGAYEALRETASPDPLWRVVQLALGARSERRQIAVADVSQLSSFRALNRYAAEELPEASAVTHTEEVEIKALDDCWEELLNGVPHGRPFLKLDTQGWDLEVLEGAVSVLEQMVGLQLEASLMPIYEDLPSFPHTVEKVRSLGFDMTGVFPVNRDSLFRLIEVDCVFINPHHAHASGWREETWTLLTARFRQEVAGAVPPGRQFVLVDGGALGIDELEGRPAIPFLERGGEYYGPPEDGGQAIAELVGETERGVRHIAFAWPSFWWLEEYPELAQYLHERWRMLVDSSATKLFELGGA